MALPAQAIEKLSHSPERTTGVYSQLLMLSLSLLILAVFLFLGLKYGYEPYLNSRITKLDAEIERFGQEIPADKQAEMATFYSQIVNLRTVLGNHTVITPLWSWLEKNTLQNVYFSKVTVNIASDQATVQGGARSNADIMSQFAVIENSPEVESLVFGNVNNTPQGWQFNATIFFKPSFFSNNSRNAAP